MNEKVLCLLLVFVLATLSAKAQSAPVNPPEAAPGITLPSKGGIYALDPGSPEKLVKLTASELLLNQHTGKNLAKNTFYVGSRRTLEIAGPMSKTNIESTDASFFIRLNPDQPSLDMERITLVQLEHQEKVRIVADLDANVWGGGAKRKLHTIQITKQMLPGDEWVKIVPIQKLMPGQYAIVILPKDPKLFPDTAFDFLLTGTAP
jgi:hypothetical protein